MSKHDKAYPGRITTTLLLGLGLTVTVAAFAAKDNNKGLGQAKKAGAEAANAFTGISIGGTTSAPEYYHISEDLDLGDVTFDGPTVIVADGDITISGNPVVTANGKVTIYFAGDFTVSGTASINNLGRPKNLTLYATQEFDEETMTDADRQTVTLNGNVDFVGVVYAPEAKFVSNGGGGKGGTFGALLAYNATFNGKPGPFHYDESLANETLPNQPFSTSGYRPIRDPNTQLVDNDPNLGTYNQFIDGFFGG
ncbi:DUF7305 domain-containing protein [Cerasicoccus maritimus]|uniref:DUF7305 domain-containing protein n=1 Tax=Cerasicoccus maritimus TaxID=490089 RepID=UPI002852CF1E|nr:hypothetical protein [Cerasicoccus maritimus]